MVQMPIMDKKTTIESATIENEQLKLTILNLGATIHELVFKDAEKKYNVVLNYPQLENYRQDSAYLNCVVGPHAGRVKNGRYLDGGAVVQLEQNEGDNHLHGGSECLGKQYFDLTTLNQTIVATYYDKNQTKYQIEYSLNQQQVNIKMQVIPQQRMLLNLTQHTYFNLGRPAISDLKLQIDADEVYYLDQSQVPSDKKSVKNTVFDFNQAQSLANTLKQSHPQFQISKQIDHPFKINHNGKLRLYNESDGICLEVASDAPFMVVYFGNYLENNEFKLKDHAAVAVEPQALPNGVNLDEPTQQIFDANEIFSREITYHIYKIGTLTSKKM